MNAATNRQLKAQYATGDNLSVFELNPSIGTKLALKREISSEQRPVKIPAASSLRHQSKDDYIGTTQVSQTSINGGRMHSAQVGLKGGRSSIQSMKPPMSTTFHNSQQSQANGLASSNSTSVIPQRLPGARQPSGQGTKDETSTFLEKSQMDRLQKLQNDFKRSWRGILPE